MTPTATRPARLKLDAEPHGHVLWFRTAGEPWRVFARCGSYAVLADIAEGLRRVASWQILPPGERPDAGGSR